MEFPWLFPDRWTPCFNFDLTLSTLTSPLTLDFQSKLLKLLYLRNGRVDSLGMKGMWVGYDVGCTRGFTMGHGAWQVDRPSDGSMWNSYSFQSVCPWWLFVHWSRGWGVLSFSERFFIVNKSNVLCQSWPVLCQLIPWLLVLPVCHQA